MLAFARKRVKRVRSPLIVTQALEGLPLGGGGGHHQYRSARLLLGVRLEESCRRGKPFDVLSSSLSLRAEGRTGGGGLIMGRDAGEKGEGRAM